MGVERAALGVADPHSRSRNEKHDDRKPAFHDLTAHTYDSRRSTDRVTAAFGWGLPRPARYLAPRDPADPSVPQRGSRISSFDLVELTGGIRTPLWRSSGDSLRREARGRAISATERSAVRRHLRKVVRPRQQAGRARDVGSNKGRLEAARPPRGAGAGTRMNPAERSTH